MPVTRRRFTADEYERMAEVGILGEDDAVELLEGEVVEMAPVGPRHAGCVKRLNRLFTSRLGELVVVSVQDPIRLGPRSEPQPDLALLRPRVDLYSQSHPQPDEVLLVVEISATTATFDRLVKMPLYARGGVPQAWLVDLDGEVVDVYRLTPEGSYGDPQRVRGNGRVTIDSFPDVPITAAEILG